MNLGNCPRCGKLYATNLRDVCPNCVKEIDKEYEKCASFLKENRGCTMQELSDETGVSNRQIAKFIREGRISIMNAPNMGYPCEVCGTFIRDSNMCPECRSKLIKDVNSAKEQFSRGSQPSKQGGTGAYQIGSRTHENSSD
ncbi:TIGR03826 family flagellar region protein [Paenibacillus abyssi]|uniref:Flagellar protein n=1 Tax=Paenibacillus abyssi TaxID=1340531 RepID=A0A917FL26_9BACL|nr:TIGR03826 family flagellar region protein [Paenibacillus abyssi]GGF91558.1 hypothetical protein GCM10010916_06070 [Paenibacillus abyssi]